VLKIVRLVAVYGFLAIFVVPAFSQKMGEAVGKVAENANAGQGGGPVMPKNFGETISTVYGIAFSSFAVAMILFGAIYPIIMLCVLTRPGVKAACGEIVTAPPAEAT